MYSISDAVVSYTRGSGYTAAIPGCAAKIRWGEEFWAEMNAKVKPSAGGAGDAAPVSRKGLDKADIAELAGDAAPVSRKGLDKADIAELAGKYNPRQISQEEYDALLDELVEREYLTRDETARIGYGGLVVTGSLADGTAFSGGMYITDLNSLPGRNPFALSYTFADANGDILSWAKVQSIMEPWTASSEKQLAFAKGTSDAFKALAAVLDAMQAQRKE